MDDDTNETFFTDVGCKLLDCAELPLQRLCPPPGQGDGLRAADPAQRAAAQLAAADLRLSPGGGGRISTWWHPLVSGDPETVHAAGISVRGRVAASEKDVPDEQAGGICGELAGEGAEGGEEAGAGKGEADRETRALVEFNGRSRGREQTINSL